MSKIAVTGCAGFVGSWICDKALAAGHEIIGIDNLASGVNFTPSKVEFHELDLNDNIQSVLNGVDAVVHAASYAEIRHNWEDRSERQRLFKNNEVATISLLEQMPEVPIIYLSSASIYGSASQFNNKVLSEKDANSSTIESPYAASKYACEAYIAAWSHKRQVPWYNLRLVNQVGARIHRGVIVDFCKMAFDKKHIHAADNGKQRKNWVAVEDTADAIVYILNNMNKVPSDIYTVASAERWSWHDIVDVMKKMYKEKYPDDLDPFSLTFEDRAGGAIGDPINLNLSNEKLSAHYACIRPVEKYVREALIALGWSK